MQHSICTTQVAHRCYTCSRPASSCSGWPLRPGDYALAPAVTGVLLGWPLLCEHARSAQSKNLSTSAPASRRVISYSALFTPVS